MSTTNGNMKSLKVTDKAGNVYVLAPVDTEARQAIDEAKNLQFDDDFFTSEVSQDQTTVSVGLNGVPIGIDTDSPLKFVQDNEQGIVFGSDAPFSTALAPEYDPTATYAKGEPCTYDGLLYACKDGIAVAEQWNAAHWDKTDVATLLAAKASTATTLAGYGITDASITESQGTKTVTLGNESLVPMMSASTPLSASGNSLSLIHTTATFTTYVDSGDGTPLAIDENTPLLADEVELVDSIGGKELLARRAYQDEAGNNIKTGKASSISLAPEFSQSRPYAKDEVVMYGGELRKFTSAHPAGSWSALDNKAIDIITLLKEMNTNMKTFTLFAPTGASYQLTNGSTRVSAHFTQGSDTVLALDPVSTMVNAKAGFKAGDTIRITGMQIKAAGGAGLQVPAVDSTSSPAINGKAGTLSLKLVEVDSTGAAVSGGATLSFAASVVEWDTWEEKDISLTVPELTASGAGFSIQADSASAYECDDYNLQDAYKDQYVKPVLLVQVEVDRLVKLSDGTDIV